MRKKSITILLALSFVLSFFLPAYEGLKGYQCAWFCIVFIFEHSPELWTLLYYPAFNVTNLFMIFLFTAGISGRRIKRRRFVNGLGFVLLAHTLSWSVLHTMGDARLSGIGIGYYVWFLSMTGMVILTVMSPGKGESRPVEVGHQADHGKSESE